MPGYFHKTIGKNLPQNTSYEENLELSNKHCIKMNISLSVTEA
jgi:hypothetical protein